MIVTPRDRHASLAPSVSLSAPSGSASGATGAHLFSLLSAAAVVSGTESDDGVAERFATRGLPPRFGDPVLEREYDRWLLETSRTLWLTPFAIFVAPGIGLTMVTLYVYDVEESDDRDLWFAARLGALASLFCVLGLGFLRPRLLQTSRRMAALYTLPPMAFTFSVVALNATTDTQVDSIDLIMPFISSGCLGLLGWPIDVFVAYAVLSSGGMIAIDLAGGPVVGEWFYLLGAALLLPGFGFSFMADATNRRAFVESKLLEEAMDKLDAERQRGDELMATVLPPHFAEFVKAGHRNLCVVHESATVLLYDIVGFTRLSAALSPHEVARLLDRLFKMSDALCGRHGVEKIHTIGDAYLAICTAPAHASMMMQFASSVLAGLQRLQQSFALARGIEIRLGVATGPVTAAVLGTGSFSYGIFGKALEDASRAEANGVVMRIHADVSTVQALGPEALVLFGLQRDGSSRYLTTGTATGPAVIGGTTIPEASPTVDVVVLGAGLGITDPEAELEADEGPSVSPAPSSADTAAEDMRSTKVRFAFEDADLEAEYLREHLEASHTILVVQLVLQTVSLVLLIGAVLMDEWSTAQLGVGAGTVVVLAALAWEFERRPRYLTLAAYSVVMSVGTLVVAALADSEGAEWHLFALYALPAAAATIGTQLPIKWMLGCATLSIGPHVLLIAADPTLTFTLTTIAFGYTQAVVVYALVIGRLNRLKYVERVQRLRIGTRINAAHQRLRAVLLNVAPDHVLRRLGSANSSADTVISDPIECATIAFVRLEVPMGVDAPGAVRALVDLVSTLDELVLGHGLERIKLTGSPLTYIAVSGIAEDSDAGASAQQCVLACLRMVEAARQHHAVVAAAGVHSGPITAGVLGRLRVGYDVHGDAVNLAARLAGYAVKHKQAVVVSAGTRALVSGAWRDVRFGDAVAVELKGKGVIKVCEAALYSE